jgi:hypothetical protein
MGETLNRRGLNVKVPGGNFGLMTSPDNPIPPSPIAPSVVDVPPEQAPNLADQIFQIRQQVRMANVPRLL